MYLGIFHNKVPAVITFSPIQTIDERSTPIFNYPILPTTPSIPEPISTTVNVDDENVIWEDSELDVVVVESTTTAIPTPSTTTAFSSTEYFYEEEDENEYDQTSTVPPESVEHFEFIENILPSSTIAGGIAIAEDNSQLNWWDLNDFSPPTLPLPINFFPTTIAPLPSTPVISESTTHEEDDWTLFNTSAMPAIVPFEPYPGLNSEVDLDLNDYFLLPLMSSTAATNSINNSTPSFVPFYFTDYKNQDPLLNLMKPAPTLAMPPFSWMLHLAAQNQSKPVGRQNSHKRIKKKNDNKKRVNLQKTLNHGRDNFYDYCKKKQCQYGGRLNSDCLCICLPAFSGNNCERSKKKFRS